MELITSRRNPLVARLRTLHQPKRRRELGLLLLEGTHQIQELLRLGHRPEQLLATPAWLERYGDLIAAAAWQPQPVGDEVLAAVATTDSPDGVVATLVDPSAEPYWQLDWTQPTVLLMGNEGAGLHPELAELATHRVTIPHSAAVESLNVAVAAAPLLLERCRQDRTATAEP